MRVAADIATQFPGRFVGVAFVETGLGETAEKVLCVTAQAVIEFGRGSLAPKQ